MAKAIVAEISARSRVVRTEALLTVSHRIATGSVARPICVTRRIAIARPVGVARCIAIPVRL